jgi:dienelactone hydrolase
VRPFFKDDDFNFLTEIVLGATYHGAADVGEVLTTVDRIHNGKHQSWVDEWTATADRLAEQAGKAAAEGHDTSASRQWLRASMYYSMASYSADGAGDPELFAALWEKHQQAWDQFVDLTDVHIERIRIPYEDTTLPGYFFRSGPEGEARRTFIFNNGSDGPEPCAWIQGVADALERGWNAVSFAGPGENAALVRQGLAFRPDWENVITPLIDHIVERDDVDADRIALLGASQGGYWVARAAAFEHRLAAVVADPGVLDVSTTIWGHLPHSMTKLVEAGEQEKFDERMATALKFSKSLKAMMALRMRPYGTTSPYEFFAKAKDFTLTDEMIASIECPILLLSPENEQFWPGQAEELHDKLTGDKALVVFTEEEGADGHCEPAGLAIRGERVFDWLDQKVPA